MALNRRAFLKSACAVVVAALTPAFIVRRSQEQALNDAIKRCWLDGEVPLNVLVEHGTYKAIQSEDGVIYKISSHDTPFMKRKSPVATVDVYVSDFGVLEVKHNAL